MKASRSQIGRLLDLKDSSVALGTLQRDAKFVGRSLQRTGTNTTRLH